LTSPPPYMRDPFRPLLFPLLLLFSTTPLWLFLPILLLSFLFCGFFFPIFSRQGMVPFQTPFIRRVLFFDFCFHSLLETPFFSLFPRIGEGAIRLFPGKNLPLTFFPLFLLTSPPFFFWFFEGSYESSETTFPTYYP